MAEPGAEFQRRAGGGREEGRQPLGEGAGGRGSVHFHEAAIATTAGVYGEQFDHVGGEVGAPEGRRSFAGGPPREVAQHDRDPIHDGVAPAAVAGEHLAPAA